MNHVQRSCTGTDFTVPDSITPVRGVRVFGLDNRGRLSAARFPHYYNPGENTAVCLRDRSIYPDAVSALDRHPSNDRCPSPACTCGFYGFWDLDAYFGDGWNKKIEWNGMYHVIGIIEAYGRVLLGTKGFRAEKARVVAVNVKMRSKDDRVVARMQRLYPNVVLFENEKKGIKRKRNIEGSGTRLMVAEFPLYEPGDEDGLWEWDRG